MPALFVDWLIGLLVDWFIGYRLIVPDFLGAIIEKGGFRDKYRVIFEILFF
jgi:hypothetical protein